MKTLVLALLVPVALCAACSKTDESAEMPTPAPEATPTTSASGNAAVTANPANTAPVTTPADGLPPTAHVSFVSAAGNSVNGDITVTNQGDAVAIRGVITGLAPGSEHGFHVHEFGDCSLPDFKSAGDHYNPTMDPHGKHLGDLPNIKADKDGHAAVDVLVRGPTLVDSDGAPTQIIGKSLVIHARPDDHKSQPSGGSGDRIACGVISVDHL
jgi:Cu-Zn family superoxide dismutase